MSRPLERRLAALGEAAEIAAGRLDPDAVDHARRVSARAGQRLGLGLEATVVALAGPTGAGKSTLFNSLAGAELSTAGARRPTTATATAAVWGDADDRLLDWLAIPRRHRLPPGDASGLVLLDLPDFDSVEADHRREFERVLELIDLVVWVVDPQKYADSALHDRYLVPLARHSKSTIVVLNQSDLLSPDALDACRRDLEQLLHRDGLNGTPVLPLSARSGEGLRTVRDAVRQRVADRKVALERLGADVTAAAAALDAGCDGRAAKIGRGERAQLTAALADAAGLPLVTRAVEQAHRRRGALATGWPFVRWIRRLRPDPLRRLRLNDSPQPETRSSLPGPSPVQKAQVFETARALAGFATDGLPEPWPRLARDAAIAREDKVPALLDKAVAGADLRMRPPRWWSAAHALQRLLAALVVVGVLWLVALVALGFLHLDDVVPLPELSGIPLPTLLLVGGALAGLVLALACRIPIRAGATRRGRRAAAAISSRVEAVAAETVIGPLEEELRARDRLCEAVKTARAG